MSSDDKFGMVYDDDAISEAFDALETVAEEKAKAVCEAMGRPQDEAMIFTIGMVLAYRRSRAWLRNMQRLTAGTDLDDIARLISEDMPKWDRETDEMCANGGDA